MKKILTLSVVSAVLLTMAFPKWPDTTKEGKWPYPSYPEQVQAGTGDAQV